MYYMIYQTKCKVYNTKNNKYITLCEKDYYVRLLCSGNRTFKYLIQV